MPENATHEIKGRIERFLQPEEPESEESEMEETQPPPQIEYDDFGEAIE